ncbi:CD209 antigen-like protein C isoform X2 [Rhineura floridana]|uniref:CD209 antigen-like protein C isoform X2 n=1 Tax=Rhineura floridana TaxID=261503 RepID=UPI002AC8235C|nr:CD209 antigen-like protein C isoform X2 [Rhineura floridana]
MYNNLKTAPIDPRLDPLMKLRSTMATTFKSPKLNYDNAIKVAAQVKTLPDQLAAEQQAYKKRKLKYQNLFKKSARSADGWVVFGRSLYYISKGKKTWYDAENFCMSRDAHLASILSDDEQSYVTSQLSHPAWIGLTDETQEGKWEWTDGSRLFTQYWSDGKPTRSERHGELEHDCTSIVPSSNGYNWKDAYCHELHRWVCKENLDIEGP